MLWIIIWTVFGTLSALALLFLAAAAYVAKRADKETREIYNREYRERQQVTKPKDDV